MTQTTINRRRALAVVAVVPAAVAVGLPMTAKADPGNDRLLELIRLYRAEIDAINASHGLTDEELDAWVNRADLILEEGFALPVLTAASAVAVIDLLLAEGLIASHTFIRDDWVALTKSARDYIASTA